MEIWYRKRVNIGPQRNPGESNRTYLRRVALFFAFIAAGLMVVMAILPTIWSAPLADPESHPIAFNFYLLLIFVFGLLVMVALISFIASFVVGRSD